MSRQHPNIYEFRGELLTAREIRDKYGMPERLVWKGIHDPRKPSLEKMISWREAHGIFNKTDYRYADGCKQRPHSVMPPKKRTYKFTYIEPELIKYDSPALPEYFEDVSVVIPDKPLQSLYVGCQFGSYGIIARYKRSRRLFVSVRCGVCGRCFYDLPLNLFVEHTGSGCCCDVLGRLSFAKDLPKRIQKESLSNEQKGISYYQSFVGYKICGVKITGVSQKESNGVISYIFSAQCPHCETSIQIVANDLVTRQFRHRCEKRKKKIYFKNTSCHAKGQHLCAYKRIQCKVHKDSSEVLYKLLENTMSYFSLKHGTENFMNMCLDAEFLGMKDKITNMFGIV